MQTDKQLIEAYAYDATIGKGNETEWHTTEDIVSLKKILKREIEDADITILENAWMSCIQQMQSP
jgi:hypothetical protein